MLKINCLGALLALALLAGCDGREAAKPQVYVVNVEKVLKDSKGARDGGARLEEARKILEKGYGDLRETYANAEKDARNRVLREGALALQRQMEVERQAVVNAITEAMRSQVRKWRLTHNADVVLPLQYTIDAAKNVDITDEIILDMDESPIEFPDLPRVSITKPGEQASPNRHAPAGDAPRQGKPPKAGQNAPQNPAQNQNAPAKK